MAAAEYWRFSSSTLAQMYCSEFLASYSDLRDGRVDEHRADALERHLAGCARCARYDRALHSGIGLLRRHLRVQSPPGFRRRILGTVVAARSRPEPVMPAPAGLTAAAMVAATLALVIFGHGKDPVPGTAEPERRMPVVVANPSIPLVTFTELESVTLDPAAQSRMQDSTETLADWIQRQR